MTADAAGVRGVGLLESVSDAGVLCDEAISQPDISELLLSPVIHRPPHNGHKCRITNGCTPLELDLELASVIRLVTGLTQCNEVVRGVPARLAGLDVMYI